MDDASWITGFMDIFDPALDNLKKLLHLDEESSNKTQSPSRDTAGASETNTDEPSVSPSSVQKTGNETQSGSRFNVDAFIKERLSLDPSNLDIPIDQYKTSVAKKIQPAKRIWRSGKKRAAKLASSKESV